MKKINLLYITFIINVFAIQAQVGIGTENPETDLHVAGDVLIQNTLEFGSISKINNTEENFKLLTRIKNSNPPGEIKVLDIDQLTVPPISVINYHINNIIYENVTDLDLGYDNEKYLLGLANFRIVGDPLQKADVGTTQSIGNFANRLFENNGTWHLEIRNRRLNLPLADSVEYYITLLVYDKKYFKALPDITTNLGGLNSGNASSIPILN